MSSLLQEAIMDAKKIREAAKKVALNSLKEKYSSEFKKTFKSQLRKISEADNPFQEDDLGGEDPGMDPDLMDNEDTGLGDGSGIDDLFSDPNMGGQEGGTSIDQGDKDFLNNTPAAFDEDSSLNDQEIEIDLGEIQKTIDKDLEQTVGLEDRTSFGGGNEMDEDLPGEPEVDQGLPGDESNEDFNLDDEIDTSSEDDERLSLNKESLRKYLDFEEDFSRKINEVSSMNRHLTKEVKSLMQENKKLKERLKITNESLYTSNIQNAKLVYKNKILVDGSLNERQKKSILESIEKLSDSEVEILPNIFSVLKEAVGAADKNGRKKESLTEILSTKNSASHIVGNSTEKDNKEINEGFDKWRKLARLIKD